MERSEWLKKMRLQAEALYDHWSPAYWDKFGITPNETHRQFLEKFLGRMEPHSSLLDAACGAGKYDGILLKAGHRVLGIDQSGGILSRAREHFPQESYPELRYEKIGLQEMDFEAEFDGVICMDALETVCPEDWPGILARFHQALKPGGMLYATVEVADSWDVDMNEAYEQSRALGMPVVFGEVIERVEDIDAAFAQGLELDELAVSGEQAYLYHYYPSLEQVRMWLDQAGLAIEEEGMGDGYAHFLARKNAQGFIKGTI